MGSDESHFNVSLIVGDKVTRQCPQTTTFEDRVEPKRNWTEGLLLTSLTPYRLAKNRLTRAFNFTVSAAVVRNSYGCTCRVQVELLVLTTEPPLLVVAVSERPGGSGLQIAHGVMTAIMLGLVWRTSLSGLGDWLRLCLGNVSVIQVTTPWIVPR